jgi:hypothetical protein
MGQDVHVGCKISNVAALAASTIVHCQLSIVNFSGFAITSINKTIGTVFKLCAAAALLPAIAIAINAQEAKQGAEAKEQQGAKGQEEKVGPQPNSGTAPQEANKPRKNGIKPIKDDPEARAVWKESYSGTPTVEYLDYKNKVGKQEVEKWGHMIPGTRAFRPYAPPPAADGLDKAAIPPAQWLSKGPLDGAALQNDARDPNISDTGRPTAILLHPNNANIIYVGFSGGGLWRSANADLATDNDWVWECMTDGLPSGGSHTSVGGAAFKDGDPNTIYLSLGDWARYSGGAPGVGFFISADAGATWAQGGTLGQGDNQATSTKAIISLPNNIILVSTNVGMYRSTNGGSSFALVSSGGMGATRVWDIVRLGSGRLVATYDNDGGKIAWSDDSGQTWTQAAITSAPANLGRISICAANGADNNSIMMYGLYEQTDNSMFPKSILRSANGGETWSPVNDISTLYHANNDDDEGDGGQAAYNQMIAVNPDNADQVFIGTNLSLHRSVNAATGTPTFAQFTSWLGQRYQYMHADKHLGVWTPPGRRQALYLATDGGISIIRDPGIDPIPNQDNDDLFLSRPEIIDHRRNRGLPTHLVYKIGSTNATMPANARDKVIIGTQDNGTLLRKNTATEFYDFVLGGDGFGCLIHPYNGNLMLGSAYFSEIYRTANGGAAPNDWDSAKEGINTSDPGGTPFNTPLILDMADPAGNRVYTYTNRFPYVSDNFGERWRKLFDVQGTAWEGTWNTSVFNIRGMEASPLVEGLIGIVSLASVTISKDGGKTWTGRNLSGSGSGAAELMLEMSCIGFDTKDPNIIYAGSAGNSFNNHLVKSTDGGDTWLTIDGSRANPNGFPYGSPVHVIKVDPLDNQVVYIGTDYGVYFSANQGTTWSRYGHGLPMVQVRDLYVAPDGSYMRAATHGRGVWEMEGITSGYAPVISSHPANRVIAVGQSATFGAVAIGIPAPTVQWQVSVNGGSSWSNISGATNSTYAATFTGADNGKRFRILAANSFGSTPSNAATLTVQAAPQAGIAIVDPPGWMLTGRTATFRANVVGLGSGAVTWSSSAGAIDPATGQFTAPPTAQNVIITATSVQMPTLRAEIQVMVTSRNADFDGNARTNPQLLNFANAFGSTARADLDMYDLNDDGKINDVDAWILFRAMGW